MSCCKIVYNYILSIKYSAHKLIINITQYSDYLNVKQFLKLHNGIEMNLDKDQLGRNFRG